ncbi:hypothetical protein [Sporosarcina sp. FSL W7-1283]|uniref:hypothetical protein n=1 Tax=Sporosarcina sp. FSL W7-1283 TaxID=2921560 RepID=UPI0030F648A5
MFSDWKKKRLLEKLQEECFHDYHTIHSYKVEIGYYSSNVVTRYDMYCPICDKTIYGIDEVSKTRHLERQKVRKTYKESY